MKKFLLFFGSAVVAMLVMASVAPADGINQVGVSATGSASDIFLICTTCDPAGGLLASLDDGGVGATSALVNFYGGFGNGALQ